MPTSPVSRRSPFDEFYLASRRRLVLETYALTGDLSAARSAVRDAFVAAAPPLAQGGPAPRPRGVGAPPRLGDGPATARGPAVASREGAHAEQKSVLDALHHLPDQQRKVLLLTHLAGLSRGGHRPRAGRDRRRGSSTSSTRPTRAFCEETGTGARRRSSLRSRRWPRSPRRPHSRTPLRSTGPAADAGGCTPWSAWSRILALTLVGGAFVVRGGVAAPASAQEQAQEAEAEAGDRGDAAHASRRWWRSPPRGPGGWSAPPDNTAGTGINTVCQDTRFADPRGRGTFVRKFVAPGKTRRNYLETVEISQTPRRPPRRTGRRWAGSRAAARRGCSCSTPTA